MNGLNRLTSAIGLGGEPDDPYARQQAATRRELLRSTLGLAALFWTGVLITDSLIWGLAGVDPVQSFGGKLIIDTCGAVMALALSVVLILLRDRGLPVKAVAAFSLSTLVAAGYSWLDLTLHRWSVWPKPVPFVLREFGLTMVSSMATFFGWSCLYIALLYRYEVRERERLLAVAREEGLNAQMRALRYQVNPHFLFNTLNSIAGLIEERRSDRAKRVVLALSGFLRSTLELDPLHDLTLAEELALQEGYLEIERERFPDRLVYAIDVEPAALEALVPALILQPLVENAVKHGVGRSTRPVAIAISARCRADRLLLEIDNDIGRETRALAGLGIGLGNVTERIRARYGADARFKAWMPDPLTFRVELDLPRLAA